MKIKSSNTTNSSIVAMGSRLAKAMEDTGNEYLMLNRGVNSVVNINLQDVVNEIDFNSTQIQVYPGTKGKIHLRKAINEEYFNNQALLDNILVTAGGISGLDICFQNLDVNEVLFPPFFWGTYKQLANLRKLHFSTYKSYKELGNSAKNLSNKAIIICDPGNPLGEKYPDAKLIELIKILNDKGASILFDSPYRRLFYDRSDTFYQQLMQLENVIIIESFSKSVGLSGQRIGFIHSSNTDFTSEAALRLMYATNGINSFAQELVTKLLASSAGILAVKEFKQHTTIDIKSNVNYLKNNGLLADNFYAESLPLGIFSVVRFAPEKLFEHRIGSVGLDYFVNEPFEGIDNYSRILVSYPHEKFVSFFQTLI